MGFRDPIVSGETLVRDAIESEGFVSGVTGWSIQRDGNAEFNDITARGTVISRGPTKTVTVANGTVEITDNDAPTDQSLTRLDGDGLFMQNADSSQDFTFGLGPSYSLLKSSFGDIVLWNDLSHLLFMDNADGFLKRGQFNGPDVEDVGWVAMSLSTGVGAVAARLLPDGTVILQGSQAPAVNTVGTDLFTLPAGYRPTGTRRYETSTSGTTSNGTVQVSASGLVEIAKAAGAAQYWFDSVRFSTI